jgi:RNA polymerase sigma-70 factor (ECF subfamily)
MSDLAKLYDLHAAALYAFLRQLTQSEADAQDLLQGVFVRLAQSAERGEVSIRHERSYLLTVAHRLFLDALRRQDSRARTLRAWEMQSALFVATPSESPFDAESLEAALGKLPTDQRAVVHLKIWEGQTLEEIATLLEIPVPTATSRYRYALQKLRKHFTSNQPTP